MLDMSLNGQDCQTTHMRTHLAWSTPGRQKGG